MSTEPAPAQPNPPRIAGQQSALRRVGEPRSTLWRVAVGTTPVVATALTLEFGRTLVVDSFGETEVVETLASTLRAFWILLIVGGVLFAGYRWYAQRQDGEQLARTLALLDSLDEPGVAVDGIPRRPDSFTPPDDPARNSTEAKVIQLLPVRWYDGAMLLAVTTALTDAARSLREPDTREPTFDTATDLCEHLVNKRILAVHGARSYITEERTASANDEIFETPAWAAALYALVREHADRASARATALGHPDYVAKAEAWFRGAESGLREVVRGAASSPHPAVLPQLVRIIDALDVYYGYDSRSADLRTQLAAHPNISKFPLHDALLTLRADPTIKAYEHHRPLAWSTAVAARSRHGRALDRFANGETPDKVARKLRKVWRLVPRADLSAEVCVLVNLAVVELRRNELEAAGNRLELAFARTENGRDPGGRVHATEILGILHWMRGEQIAALLAWRTAWTGYRALGDERGQGRCLRHLGSALVKAPQHAGVALAPPTGSLHHDTVLFRATGWLTEADRLDPDSPVPTPPGTPTSAYVPPPSLIDPHLRISRPTDP